MPWRGSGRRLCRLIIDGPCPRRRPLRKPSAAVYRLRRVHPRARGSAVREPAGAPPRRSPPPSRMTMLPVMLSLSSGTTGRPSGSLVSHRELYETMDQPMGGHRLQRARPFPARHAALFRCGPIFRDELSGRWRHRDLPPAAGYSGRNRSGGQRARRDVCFWCRPKFAACWPSARTTNSPCRACACW